MARSKFQPPPETDLQKFELQYSGLGRWFRLMSSWFLPQTWREVGDAAGKNPAFNTNWENYAATDYWNTCAFYKDQFGVVHLKGLVYNTVGSGLNTTIYTLPEAYRPLKNYMFPSIGNNVFARVDVMSNGNVYLSVGTGSAFLLLDGITFRSNSS